MQRNLNTLYFFHFIYSSWL